MRTEIRLSKTALGLDLFSLLLEYAEAREQSPVATLVGYLEAHKADITADYDTFLSEQADRQGKSVEEIKSDIRARLFQKEPDLTPAKVA